MKTTKDELNSYADYLDRTYGEDNPRLVRRFQDAFFELGNLSDSDGYLDLHYLYRKPVSLDLLTLLFEEDIRGNFHDLEQETYMVNGFFTPTPVDVGGFIEDMVRNNVSIHWKESIFRKYFIRK